MKLIDHFFRGTLVVTLTIHVLGFVPGIHLRFDSVWPFALLPLCALVTTIGTFFGMPRREYKARLKRLAWWVRWGAPIAGLYSIAMGLNHLTSAGRPKSLPSGFVLVQHDRVLRSLTETEYWHLARAEVAFIFGSLIWFACDALVDRAIGSVPASPIGIIEPSGTTHE